MQEKSLEGIGNYGDHVAGNLPIEELPIISHFAQWNRVKQPLDVSRRIAENGRAGRIPRCAGRLQ